MEVQNSSILSRTYDNGGGGLSYAEKLSHLSTTDEKLCLVMQHIDNYSRALNNFLIESINNEKQRNSELKREIKTLEEKNIELNQEIITKVERLLKEYLETDNYTELRVVKLNNVMTVIRGKRHLHGKLIGHNGSKIKQLHDKYKGISIIIPTIDENDFTDIIIHNLNADYKTADDLISEIVEILTGN